MAAGVGVWIAVVVLGSGASTEDSLLGVKNFEVVWAALMGVGVLAGLVLVVTLWPSGERNLPDKKPRNGLWFLLVLALILLWWQPSLLDGFVDEEPQEGAPLAATESAVNLESEPAAETVAQATDLLLLAGAVVLVGVVWYVLRRRTSEPQHEPQHIDEKLEADLFHAIEAASVELMSGADPRTAVLNAYALLESALATHGMRRSLAETPTEHLRRALQGLRVDSVPLVRLGELYEVARFSQQPVTATEAQAAAEALDRASAELSRLT